MTFSTYFSKQARKPTGLFGRVVMSIIFNRGNAYLNRFVNELMSVQAYDHVLEIGFGTGKLIQRMAQHINEGHIEGIDISSSMVSIAKKRNKKYIADGKVKIQQGNFDEISYKNYSFTKACSVNTICFWSEPEKTAKKIADLLKPEGQFIVAFEDKELIEQKNLDKNIFRLYSKGDVKNLLKNAGFSTDVRIETRTKGKSVFHCAVAIK
jgi:ubiquinone/menaquinone biosynthesis C-methylase UbiE